MLLHPRSIFLHFILTLQKLFAQEKNEDIASLPKGGIFKDANLILKCPLHSPLLSRRYNILHPLLLAIHKEIGYTSAKPLHSRSQENGTRRMSQTPIPLEVFYSYADTDEPLLHELEKHLSLLKHRGLITTKIWLNKPKVEMQHVFLLLSSFTFSAKQGYDDLYKRDHHLTIEFIKDLETCNDRLLLLLVDHIDSAAEAVRTWLINTFLVRISLLKHIRVVVAGRSVPEPHGTYAASCLHAQLHPVTEEDAYIAYCRRLNVTLVEQSVRDIAFLLDYQPGMFVDYVLPKFWQPR